MIGRDTLVSSLRSLEEGADFGIKLSSKGRRWMRTLRSFGFLFILKSKNREGTFVPFPMPKSLSIKS
jgi:hypothetical protein